MRLFCLLGLSFFFWGCAEKAGTQGPSSVVVDTDVVDEDEDGIAAEEDCDDSDAALGAIAEDEDCDGVPSAEDCDDADDTLGATADDGDCDGVLAADDCDDADASLGDIAEDADCDGTLAADDCDDEDDALGPIAEDGDCDGALADEDCDDGDATLNLDDGDTDGYSTCDGDCDDVDAAVNPGASEIPEDGVDNDCDSATPDVFAGGGTFDTSVAVAVIEGNTAFANSGRTVSAGDLNGDGEVDLMLGAVGSSSGNTVSHVVYGPFSGTRSVSTADANITTPATWGGGSAVLDANADGIDDLWLGEYDVGSVGSAYLFLGPVSGTLSENDADAVVSGTTDGGRLGWFMHGSEDMTGDGLPDVILGNYASSDIVSRGGAAWVVSGAPSGSLTIADAAGGLIGDSFFDVVGYDVSSGDIDGDGVQDLTATGTNGMGGTPGSAYALFGPINSVVSRSSADMQINSTASNAFGTSITSSSDVNGDGYDDILVGAYVDSGGGVSGGAVYVFHGDPAGATGLSEASADATLYGNPGQYLGTQVHGLGDWEGDGTGDVLVTSYYNASGQDDGTVYLFRGPLEGSVSLSDAFIVVEGASSDRSLGGAIATMPDEDGDGRDELVLAAPATTVSSTSTAGKTYLFLSSDL